MVMRQERSADHRIGVNLANAATGLKRCSALRRWCEVAPALTAVRLQIVADPQKRNKLFIMFIGFSSRAKQERDFRQYLMGVIIITAILLTAIFAGIFIRENCPEVS